MQVNWDRSFHIPDNALSAWLGIGEPADGVYLQSAANGNWQFVTARSGTRTIIDTGVAFAPGYYHASVMWQDTLVRCLLSEGARAIIDLRPSGQSVTVSTNIPDVPPDDKGVAFFVETEVRPADPDDPETYGTTPAGLGARHAMTS